MPQNNELYHWKYIKRERVKGKWKYWYPDDSKGNNKPGVKEENIFEKAKSTVNKTADKIVNAVKDKYGVDEKEALNKAESAARTQLTRTANVVAKNNVRSTPVNARAEQRVEVAMRQYTTAVADFIKAEEAYMNTPMSKVEKIVDIIQDGIEAVAGMFDEPKNKNEIKLSNGVTVEIIDPTNPSNPEEEKSSKKEDLLKNMSTSDIWQYMLSEEIDKLTAIRLEEQERQERQQELNQLKEELEEHNPLPELPTKETATTIDEDMELVNPEYDPLRAGTSMNCAYCTLAYDMRRRGYDVEAAKIVSEDGVFSMFDYYELPENVNKLSKNAWLMDRVHTMYGNRTGENGEHDTRDEAVSTMIKEMEALGEGARGNLSLGWTNGGGHSIAWEVENGKAVFRDCQTNKIVDIKEYTDRAWSFAYARFDDLTPSKKMLEKVKARK